MNKDGASCVSSLKAGKFSQKSLLVEDGSVRARQLFRDTDYTEEAASINTEKMVVPVARSVLLFSSSYHLESISLFLIDKIILNVFQRNHCYS
jgi:hypothetical protein